MYIYIYTRIFVRALRALDSHILPHELGTSSIVQSPEPRNAKTVSGISEYHGFLQATCQEYTKCLTRPNR